jgi:glyoxylase-like metal-dependent hydrolase (beta-lactamase superfamily II)
VTSQRPAPTAPQTCPTDAVPLVVQGRAERGPGDDGVVLFGAAPTIGGNLRRAADTIAAANGVTHLVCSHHHADHGGAASLFKRDVVRIGHEETRRMLLRDNHPARPLPEVTLADRYTSKSGASAWSSPAPAQPRAMRELQAQRWRTASVVGSQGGHRSPNYVQGGPL